MNTQTTEQKSDTLFGGRDTTVIFEDGNTGATRVSQLRLCQYEEAFKQFDNEFALVGMMCGKNEAWAKTLSPESYEAVYVIAMEVNATGFFVYAERRNKALLRRLNQLSPQILASATSSSSSPKLRPRPV